VKTSSGLFEGFAAVATGFQLTQALSTAPANRLDGNQIMDAKMNWVRIWMVGNAWMPKTSFMTDINFDPRQSLR
jgi:hypothetical protein